MSQYFQSEARDQLVGWFRSYGTNPLFEIECRIKDVTEVGFERVLTNLHSNKSWSTPPQRVETCDLMHATGVRETREGQRVSFIRKERGNEFLVSTPVRHDVRFQVSKESEEHNDSSEVHNVRYKQRTTFVHKNMFKFELTKVRQGSTDMAARQSGMQFEVEIEF